MSRVPLSEFSSAASALRLALSLAIVSVLGAAPAAAQDVPQCADGPAISDCLLPPWPGTSESDLPSLFGQFQEGVWVFDADDELTDGRLDIQAVGVARIDIEDVGTIRNADGLLRAGPKKKAVKAGPAALVRIVLDRPLDAIEDGHAGIHLATDVDGARTNNAPAGVARPDGHFAGMQDIYSLTYATTTQQAKLLNSDLERAWYKGKRRFAASWAAPNVLDILVPAEAIGENLKVITYVSGPRGGYDSVTLGPGPVPVAGRVGLNPVCTEAAISGEPFTVRRLIENKQTLRDINAPASWQGGATLPLDEASRAAIEAFVATVDDDADGRIVLPSTVSLFEDGLVVRQRPEVELALDGETAQLAVRIGLTRRGYTLIRTITLEPTGDAVVDAYLDRATAAVVETAPAFRNTKKAGLLYGGNIGECVTRLLSPPLSTSDEDATPGASGEPAASA